MPDNVFSFPGVPKKIIEMHEYLISANTPAGEKKRALIFAFLKVYIATRTLAEREAKVRRMYGEEGVQDWAYRLIFGLDKEIGTPEEQKQAYLEYFKLAEAEDFLAAFHPLCSEHFDVKED